MAQIILDSSNNLIQGDFDNATINNRTKFKTTTTNATTNVYAVPNGSATSAGFTATNAADPTNASKITIATNGSTDTQIISGINGSGTYLPLSFYTNNALAAQISTAGVFSATGGIASTSMPTGSVLQVVQATVTGSVSTTSTTDVSSGLTASITPSSTSNKILLMVAGGKAYISGGQQTIVTVYRNGSTLGAGARSTPIEGTGGSNHSLTYLDSPSSTSSVTYTIYYRSNGGNTAYFQDSSTYGQATLTLLEIKG